jgi:hypothetical protein
VNLRISLLAATLLLTGCFSNATLSTTNPIALPAVTLPSSARVARIIFQQNSGSFDAPTTAGTPVGVGNGLQAVRVYDAQNNVIASNGPSGNNWPSWLQSFEIGVSGPSNANALNANCARFASTSGAEQAQTCTFNGTSGIRCGTTGNNFRVSEADCAVSQPAPGQGNDQDGVYFRAFFNRNPSILGVTENILAVVEYTASSFNGGPASPQNCFTGSGTGFAPENCSDFTWKMFLKHTPVEATQPYMMLVPPTPYYVNGSNITASGSSTTTKQFFIPLAGDQGLTEVQFSRIVSGSPALNSGNAAFEAACAPNGTGGAYGASSPLCAGMVFSSITFFRI